MWNIETLLPTKTELTQFRVQKYKKVWIYANKIEYFAKSVCFHIILRLYTLHFYTMRMRTIFKIFILCTAPSCLELKTKDEPRNDKRTLKLKKSTFIKIAVSFTSLIPSLILPTDDREKTERGAHQLPTSPK